MTYRILTGFCIGALLIAFTLLIGGIAFQFFGGRQSGDLLIMLVFPWLGIAVLAGWSGRLIQQLSERLDKIEARMSKAHESGSGAGGVG
jgi:hypothetical protein